LPLLRRLPLTEAIKRINSPEESTRAMQVIEQRLPLLALEVGGAPFGVLEEPFDPLRQAPRVDDREELLSALLDALKATPFRFFACPPLVLLLPALPLELSLPLTFLRSMRTWQRSSSPIQSPKRCLTSSWL
jgi:hypothetical protein